MSKDSAGSSAWKSFEKQLENMLTVAVLILIILSVGEGVGLGYVS